MGLEARLTVDMTKEEHSCLKMASILLGMSMREIMLCAVFEKLGKEQIKENQISDQANKILQNLSFISRQKQDEYY